MTIPDGWTVSTVEQLCHFENNRRIPVSESERAKRPGNVPYYGANGLQGYIDQAMFNEDLILLAEDGGHYDDFTNRPIAYRITGPAWVNNHAHVIKSRDPNFQNYLFYSLEHKDIRAHIVGGTRGKLNLGVLKNIPIAHPVDVSESIAIAEIIQSADDVISFQRTLISKLKMIREGALKDILTNGVDEKGVLRSPKTHEFVDTQIGPVPFTWALGPIENFLQLQRGHDLPLSARNEGNIPIIGSNGVDGTHDTQMYDAPGVITGRSGTIGKIHFVETSYWPLNTTLFVRDFRGNNPMFVAYFLEFLRLKRYSTGTGVPTLNRNLIHPTICAFPQKEEQNRIVTQLQTIDTRINSETRVMKKYEKIKIGLINDLLTGKVRVPISVPHGVEVAV